MSSSAYAGIKITFSPRHERCQHSHPVQEQGWPLWLQQLSRHLSSEHRWQSLRSGHLDPPAKPCFASLPRVTVWLQSREVHSGHDLLPPSAAGQVSRAVKAIVPRQSFWLGEQKRALQDSPENWLSSKAPGDHHLLSPGHAEYGLLRWGHLQCLPSQQWSKAGLCPCSNPVRDFLLDAAPVCLCRLYRRCLRPDEVRRQTLQHRQTPHQNQSLRGAYTGAAVCRRRCFIISQRGGSPTSGRQAVPRLHGVWANDQPQEDQHPGARCWVPPQSTPSTTRSWKLWTPSLTWAPPYQARLRSMLRSSAASPKQLPSWHLC